MSTTAIVRHRVSDFATWKEGFDAAAEYRAASGMTGAKVFTAAEDPQQVTAVLEFGSIEQAKAHLTDPVLAEKMKALGVLDKPEVSFLDPR
jgi:hypothetical protein